MSFLEALDLIQTDKEKYMYQLSNEKLKIRWSKGLFRDIRTNQGILISKQQLFAKNWVVAKDWVKEDL